MDKRTYIRNSALEIFKQQGNITAREVSSFADVNVASINYYFGSKDKLMLELFNEVMTDLNHKLESIWERVKTLEELKEIFSKEIYDLTGSAPGFFKFVVQIISGSYQLELMDVDDSDFYVSTVHNFVTQIILRFSDVKDPIEIQNRVVIFITSLAVSLITAGAAMDKEMNMEMKINVFKDEYFFKSYVHSLIDLIVR